VLLERIRVRLTYANVMASIAVLIALGAGAYAAGVPRFASAGTGGAIVYEGHIKGLPGAGFDLRFAKANGKLFLNAIDHADTPVTCEDGQQTITGNSQFPPTSESRVRDGAFDIRQDSGNGDFVRVAGELKGGGKAAGIYKERATFGPPRGVCTTGKLGWVAHKT
jgi:hypothetical protein